MRPDFANGAIHTDEWCGDSRQDSDAVSDFEITHTIDSSFIAANGGCRSVGSRGFELVVVRDEDAVRTEIHFVLIEYLQLVVIWDHDDDSPD